MKKSDLKTGMILEFEDGSISVVLLNTVDGDIYSGENWGFIDSYAEDLVRRDCIDLKVMKVHQPLTNRSYLLEGELFHKKHKLKLSNYTLLWDRNEDKKEKLKQQIEQTRQTLANLENELELQGEAIMNELTNT